MGGGGSAPAPMMMQSQAPPAPPAPGSLTQTIIGGNPNPVSLVGGAVGAASGPAGVGPANVNMTPWALQGISYEEWLKRQQANGLTIVGGQGEGGGAGGSAGSGGAGAGTGESSSAGQGPGGNTGGDSSSSSE